jgi:endogenous inhibitor of DNA gyrase (YacG/DUF329 family)
MATSNYRLERTAQRVFRWAREEVDDVDKEAPFIVCAAARRSTGSLDDMWPKLDCPWCGKDVGSPRNLGTRPSDTGPKWFQFTLSERSVIRPTSVCPNCSNPVKTSQRSQRWILLVVPFALALLAQLLTFPASYVPTWAMWAFGVLGVSGGVLARVTMRLEKANVI